MADSTARQGPSYITGRVRSARLRLWSADMFGDGNTSTTRTAARPEDSNHGVGRQPTDPRYVRRWCI
jgi:hypothetical protein